MTKVQNTIKLLKYCQALRNAGVAVSYTSSASWLVNMAINRRAGWPDDPGCSRGSAMPINGQYPRKADGDRDRHLRQLADRINRPRLRVYVSELGEHRKMLMRRLPERFCTNTAD